MGGGECVRFIDGSLVRGIDGMGVEVSYSLFADDILILCDASKENLEYLSWVSCGLRQYQG